MTSYRNTAEMVRDMTTEEMTRRYRDVLGQYDRTVLHDDDDAAQRLAEVSDTLIETTRLLIERLLPPEDSRLLATDEDPDAALAVVTGQHRGSKAYAVICLAQAIQAGRYPAGWARLDGRTA